MWIAEEKRHEQGYCQEEYRDIPKTKNQRNGAYQQRYCDVWNAFSNDTQNGVLNRSLNLLYKKGTRFVFHVPLSPKLGRLTLLLSDSACEPFGIAA